VIVLPYNDGVMDAYTLPMGGCMTQSQLTSPSQKGRVERSSGRGIQAFTNNRPLMNSDHYAKHNRKKSTVSEGLLWSILRARQVCNLKFRREHPICGYIVDFACVEKKLVIEVDGGYHDLIGTKDLERQEVLTKLGWNVIRFSDKDIEGDAEAAARFIANYLGLEYSFERRNGNGSGMRQRKPSPSDRPSTRPSQILWEGEA
jgi:leucyl-tRNA synthetase